MEWIDTALSELHPLQEPLDIDELSEILENHAQSLEKFSSKCLQPQLELAAEILPTPEAMQEQLERAGVDEALQEFAEVQDLFSVLEDMEPLEDL